MSDKSSRPPAQNDIQLCNPMYNSSLVNEITKSTMVNLSELGFSVVTLLIGLVEMFMYEEMVVGCFLIVVSFAFFLLFLQFYYGLTYNCTALLLMHSSICGFLTIFLFVCVAIALLYASPTEILVSWFRLSSMYVIAVTVMTMILLLSFGAGSYSRLMELWHLEKSRSDHIRELINNAVESAKHVEFEKKGVIIGPIFQEQ